MRPLDGITVVALEQAVAAPFATRQLADLGARVIKIERPGVGDFARAYDRAVKGQASYFVWLNRSKESLTLDLKQPKGSRILEQLLAGADVFIQNLAPGATDRLGLSAATLRQRFPRLIVCDVSGYGMTGPYRDKKAYDLLIQCETGVVSITGTAETPSKAGISVADIAAGMYAYSGVLTALLYRERTGQGMSFEVSLFDALAEWISAPALYTAYGGRQPARTGASHATIVPYGPFETGDGKLVNLGVQNEREWQRFCDVVLRRPEIASDPRFDSNASRLQHREEVQAVVNEVFAGLTAEQVVARLDEGQIASARMNTVQEFWDHPQLQARGRWREVESPEGMIQVVRPPVTTDAFEPRIDPIPAVGQHSAAILQALGYSEDEVAALRDKQVI